MFGGAAATRRVHRSREVRALTPQERLDGEKETLGLYLTGHPVDEYLTRSAASAAKRSASSALAKAPKPSLVWWFPTALAVAAAAPWPSRGLDDRSGRIEASVFREVFEQNRRKLEKDAILIVEGEVLADDYAGKAELKLRAERIMTLNRSAQSSRSLRRSAYRRRRRQRLGQRLEAHSQPAPQRQRLRRDGGLRVRRRRRPRESLAMLGERMPATRCLAATRSFRQRRCARGLRFPPPAA